MGQNIEPRTQTVLADGTAVVEFRSGAQTWKVSQVTTEMLTAPLGATCRLRRNGVLISKMLPRGDVASGEPSYIIGPADVLSVTWAGCTPGVAAQANATYDDGIV